MAKATESELSLHQRIIDGDGTASHEVFNLYLEKTIIALEKKYRGFINKDPHIIWDVVADVIFNYIKSPKKYNPSLSTLPGYIRMSAEGDIKNLLAKLQRINSKNCSFEEVVELDAETGNIEERPDENPEDCARSRDVMNRVCDLITDECDREIVLMMLEGIRDTSQYADAMDISHLPLEQREKKVKQAKDRLKAKLRRATWTGIVD